MSQKYTILYGVGPRKYLDLMPDIYASFTAFRFSWFRILVNSQSAWKYIFTLNLLNTFGIDIQDFFTTFGMAGGCYRLKIIFLFIFPRATPGLSTSFIIYRFYQIYIYTKGSIDKSFINETFLVRGKIEI